MLLVVHVTIPGVSLFSSQPLLKSYQRLNIVLFSVRVRWKLFFLFVAALMLTLHSCCNSLRGNQRTPKCANG